MYKGTEDLKPPEYKWHPSFQLSADDFLYENDGEHAALTDFQLGQSISEDGTSTMGGSASNVDLNMNDVLLTADNLSFHIVQFVLSGFLR